jgi:hypothetical protein
LSNDTRFYPIVFDGVAYNLPSVTSVIGKTQAKPQLNAWYYRTTLESIAGLFSQMHWYADTLGDELSDADELQQWLEANRMTPDDVAEEASVRGREAHRLLHRLCDIQQRVGATTANIAAIGAAERSYDSGQAWSRGVAEWYLDRRPHVVATEQQVFRLVDSERGYAGTLDLLYEDEDNNLVTCDLKTRKEQLPEYRVRKNEWIVPDPPVWDSDEIQVAAYEEAQVWMEGNFITHDRGNPRRRTILAVEANGGWVEKEALVPAKVFDNLLDNYYLLGGKGGRA